MSFSLIVILILIAVGVVFLVMWLVAKSKLQPYTIEAGKYKKLYGGEKALLDELKGSHSKEVKSLHTKHNAFIDNMQVANKIELTRVQDIHNEQMKIVVSDSESKQARIEALEKALQVQLELSKPDKEEVNAIPATGLSPDVVNDVLSNGKA